MISSCCWRFPLLDGDWRRRGGEYSVSVRHVSLWCFSHVVSRRSPTPPPTSSTVQQFSLDVYSTTLQCIILTLTLKVRGHSLTLVSSSSCCSSCSSFSSNICSWRLLCSFSSSASWSHTNTETLTLNSLDFCAWLCVLGGVLREPQNHKARSLTKSWSHRCVLFTHPVGFNETNKDGEKDGGWHCLGALAKKFHHIFKCILDWNKHYHLRFHHVDRKVAAIWTIVKKFWTSNSSLLLSIVMWCLGLVSPEQYVRPPAACWALFRSGWWSLWECHCVAHWTLSRWAPCRVAAPSHHKARSPDSLYRGGDTQVSITQSDLFAAFWLVETHLRRPCLRSEARCKTETLQDTSVSPHLRCSEVMSASCPSTWSPAAEHKHVLWNKTAMINLLLSSLRS